MVSAGAALTAAAPAAPGRRSCRWTSWGSSPRRTPARGAAPCRRTGGPPARARRSSSSSSRPGGTTTAAATSWPRASSSTPSTWATRPVASRMAASTSRGETLAPAVLIMSPLRPLKYRNPSSSVDDEIARPVPAVGVEDLVALPAEVALHEERAPEVQLARLARTADRARVGVDDARSRGRGRAGRTSRGGARVGRPRRGWPGRRCRSRSSRACCGAARGPSPAPPPA